MFQISYYQIKKHQKCIRNRSKNTIFLEKNWSIKLDNPAGKDYALNLSKFKSGSFFLNYVVQNAHLLQKSGDF